MFLGPPCVFVDQFWPLGDSESNILSKFWGPKMPYVKEISGHRGVSGGPTEISDTFFESPTLVPSAPKYRLEHSNSEKVIQSGNNIVTNCNAKHFSFS